MKRIFLILTTSLFVLSSLFAQSNKSAVQALELMMKKLESTAISTNFGMVVKDANKDDLAKLSGTVLIDGNRFLLNTSDLQLVFDGKAQYAYSPQINEVTITEPTEKELAEVNPLMLLERYKNNSKIVFEKNKESAETNNIVILPKDKNSDVKQIVVRISKTNNLPTLLQLFDKKGSIITLMLAKTKENVKFEKGTFSFDSSLYDGIEINDLR